MENQNTEKNKNKENDICEELKKSIDTLILYRSLYILKKKFSSKKEIIKRIYNSFNLDQNENVEKYSSYQVSIDNFEIVAKTIFEKSNILLTIVNNPKDILLSNIFLNLNKKIEEMTGIFKEIKEYIIDTKNSLVKKYNTLFYEKKIKDKIIKDIIEKKQNQNEKKSPELKNNVNEEISSSEGKKEGNEMEENQEEVEVEIQKKIAEYNRKGKIIKTYNVIMNDNLTLLKKEEDEKNEKLKQQRINRKERYFNVKEINENNEENNLIKIKNEEKALENKINLLDLENDKNYDNIIYIETLPLIIADFIQQFPFYCIIETEDELNEELNILFDKELLEKINNYEESLKVRNEMLINREYQININRKNKIENNIKIYENLIKEKKLRGENTSYLESMLEKLLVNNVMVQNKISELKSKNKNILNLEKSETELNNNIIESNFESSNISNISKVDSKITNLNSNIKLNELRIKTRRKAKLDTNIKFDKKIDINKKTKKNDKNAKIIASLKEIFSFYSRQHNSIGAKLLFADLEKNMEQIGSSEFCKFCMEFNIPLTKQSAHEIFKKALTLSSSTNHKLRLMNFDEFLISLKLLSKEINKNQIELIKKNIEQEKIKLSEIEEKQKNYKELEKYNNSMNIGKTLNKKIFDKNEFYFQCEKNKFTNGIFNLENKYNSEINKTEEEIFNNFILYLGINAKHEYREKLKGFLLPFHSHEKKKLTTKVKNGIGSKLEQQIIEASKIFALQKEEKMKMSLYKEMMEKQNKFEEKKRIFRIKNEKLIRDIVKNENKKYSDKLIDIKNELNRKKMEKIEMQKKEEYEKKNIISWNRLENFNINSLEIDEIEKICNDTNNSDEEIINKMSEGNYHDRIKKIPKNNSAFELMSKNDNLKFPIIPNKYNNENNNTIKIDKEFDNRNPLLDVSE